MAVWDRGESRFIEPTRLDELTSAFVGSTICTILEQIIDKSNHRSQIADESADRSSQHCEAWIELLPRIQNSIVGEASNN
jgi:hypothetical protein